MSATERQSAPGHGDQQKAAAHDCPICHYHAQGQLIADPDQTRSEESIGTFPPGYVSTINTTVLNPCNSDQEMQNGVDPGTGWAWGKRAALDAINNNGLGPLGQHAGIFYRNSSTKVAAITDGLSNTIQVGERNHNLSYVTWVARSINGWLGKTSLVEGDTDKFNPSPEECWTQIMGPSGLEDGVRIINNPEAHVEDYWSRHPGGATFSLPTARCTLSSRRSTRFPGVRWRRGASAR